MTAYRPGSFFLARITGRTGWAVGVGQALAGEASRWTHAGIILDEAGTILEAEPGGARIGNIAEYAGRPLLISDGPVQQWLATGWEEGCGSCQFGVHDACSGQFPGPVQWHDCPCNCGRDDEIRDRIAHEARALGPHDDEPGVGYSALDYLALALLHLGLPAGWVRRRVVSSGHMQCAQLVDAVFRRAGIHLWDDDRLPGDVMPADLAAWAEDWAARQTVAA